MLIMWVISRSRTIFQFAAWLPVPEDEANDFPSRKLSVSPYQDKVDCQEQPTDKW